VIAAAVCVLVALVLASKSIMSTYTIMHVCKKSINMVTHEQKIQRTNSPYVKKSQQGVSSHVG
jgi:hypothetical protein